MRVSSPDPFSQKRWNRVQRFFRALTRQAPTVLEFQVFDPRFRAVLRLDPLLRSYRVHYRPVFTDVYREEKEERIRIVFTDGHATVIEQAKD